MEEIRLNITDDFIKLASMMAKVCYELSFCNQFDEEQQEMFMDVWREFDHFNQLLKENE